MLIIYSIMNFPDRLLRIFHQQSEAVGAGPFLGKSAQEIKKIFSENCKYS